MSTAEKPVKAMNMVFTTHFFGTRPPYSRARPGTLIRPTKVAAVSCQELLPVSNHDGWQAAGAAVAVHVLVARCSALAISVNNGPLRIHRLGVTAGWPHAESRQTLSAPCFA